ncbi:MAG: Crp/Fnr family transcriptional regulator [Actinobacteria bacterium]|nr:Crp/Fnr family transcriptional regulator [Actinomycetota bacterium]
MSRHRDDVLRRFEDELIHATSGIAPRTGTEIALGECQILCQLEPDQLQLLASMLIETEHEVGEVLVASGTLPDGISWLLSGEVDLFVPIDGLAHDARLRGIGPGAVFGELTMVNDDFDRGSAVTTQRTRIARLNGADWNGLWEAHPELSNAMLRGLAELLALRQRRLLDRKSARKPATLVVGQGRLRSGCPTLAAPLAV